MRRPLLKMHGSSDRLAVKQTILKSIPYVEQDVVGTIERAIQEEKERQQEHQDA